MRGRDKGKTLLKLTKLKQEIRLNTTYRDSHKLNDGPAEKQSVRKLSLIFFFQGMLDQYFSKSDVIVSHQGMSFKCRFKLHRSGVRPEFLHS